MWWYCLLYENLVYVEVFCGYLVYIEYVIEFEYIRFFFKLINFKKDLDCLFGLVFFEFVLIYCY